MASQSLIAVFAPPITTELIVDGAPVHMKFARVDFPQWSQWEERIRQSVRDYWRKQLQEAGAPDRAMVEIPIERSSEKELPLSTPEIAQRVVDKAEWVVDLLVDQAVACGLDRATAAKYVSTIPPMDRRTLAVTLTNEEFQQQESDGPLLVPLARNLQTKTKTPAAETSEKTGSSDSAESSPSSPASTSAA